MESKQKVNKDQIFNQNFAAAIKKVFMFWFLARRKRLKG